jgi:release factor glutamine methyltransferase
MSEVWTLRRVITWTQSDFERRGFESPRLEADLLAARALGLSRIQLYLDLDRPLVPSELAAVRALVERRRRFEPIAYILGEREFYGHRFEVSPAVLIPRPDTETLVERAIALCGSDLPQGAILDLCTGSGCIVISILLGATDRRGVGTDLSAEALSLARKNADALGVSARLELCRGDLFAAVARDTAYACVTINPPYIGTGELAGLDPDVRDFEPQLALDAGEDALSFYRRIAREAAPFLLPRGALLVEVGIHQAPAVAAMFAEAGLVDVRTHRDLAGIERVVEARTRG